MITMTLHRTHSKASGSSRSTPPLHGQSKVDWKKSLICQKTVSRLSPATSRLRMADSRAFDMCFSAPQTPFRVAPSQPGTDPRPREGGWTPETRRACAEKSDDLDSDTQKHCSLACLIWTSCRARNRIQAKREKSFLKKKRRNSKH